MKRFFSLSFVIVAALLCINTLLNAQNVKPAKLLLYTRSEGFVHEPARMGDSGNSPSGRALKAYFADKKVEIVETQDGGVFDGDLSQYDGFVFCTTGNLLREGNIGKPMTESGLRNLIASIRSGKGLVGFHNATDTYSNVKDDDGKDIYTKLIGARFIVHGREQTAIVTTVSSGNFPFLKDVKEITAWEEWYAMKNFNKDMHVLQVQKTKNPDGSWAMYEGDAMYKREPYPTTWIRIEGKGRVGYTSFGHSDHYFEEKSPSGVEKWGKPEVNLPRITQLIEWSIGRFNSDTTPNIDKVAPGAGEKNDVEYGK